MNLELSACKALVTGASRGIGLAIARQLHAEGAQVALNGRDCNALEQAAAPLGALALAGDVSDAASCAALAQELQSCWGTLDVLVCNVGSGRSVAPGTENAEEWLRMLSVNLLSATNAVAAFTPLLASSKHAAIVCVSSICGLEALGCPVAYAGAKAALNSFVRNSARPLAQHGIRINAVAPGNVLFEGSVWEKKLAEDAGAVQAMLKAQVPLNRLGNVQEVADLVTFIASPRAAFATGAVFTLDGGQTRG